ncbi:hypothetical protein K1719_043395 [Acacia pycnantha]|nr:hypothetical protein K1719_043395 [Acacia pycnantha]
MSFSMVSAFKGLSLASISSSFFFKGDSSSFNVASKPLSVSFPKKLPLTIQNGHNKGAGSTKNGRDDSKGQRLGVKNFSDQVAKPGSTIFGIVEPSRDASWVFGVDTLHLVQRQLNQSKTPGTSSGETSSTSGNRGIQASSWMPHNRVGQISHSVVLETFNVIGAVLNSIGIGGQSTGGVANGTQSSSANLST